MLKNLNSKELLSRTQSLVAEERRVTLSLNGADLRASEKK
jgi:hypothetical protein